MDGCFVTLGLVATLLGLGAANYATYSELRELRAKIDRLYRQDMGAADYSNQIRSEQQQADQQIRLELLTLEQRVQGVERCARRCLQGEYR